MKRVGETLLLLAAVVFPLLPSAGIGAAALAVLALLWWAVFRPPVREMAFTASALLVAAGFLATGAWLAAREPLTEEAWRDRLEQPYSELWESLEAQAEAVTRSLERELPEIYDQRQRVFQALAAAQERWSRRPYSLVLLSQRGELVAWSGEGLLHQLEPSRLPAQGRTFRASFTAATPLVVRSFEAGERSWRLVAGRSLSTDELPFGGWRVDRREYRWSLTEVPEEANADAWTLALPETPQLVALPFGGRGKESTGNMPWAQRGASAFIALALFALAVLRGVTAALRPSQGEIEGLSWLVPLVYGGAAAGAMAATGMILAAAAVVFGLLLTVIGARGLGERSGPMASAIAGGLSILGLTAGAWALQTLSYGPIDLGADIVDSAQGVCLRLAVWSSAFGLLLMAGRRRVVSRSEGEGEDLFARDTWAWGSTALLVLAAVFHDASATGLTLAVLGGAATALWSDPRRILPRVGRWVTLALLAALVAAVTWQIAYRIRLCQQLRDETLALVAPPSDQLLADLDHQLADHFSDVELADLTPRTVSGLDPQDLAFLLWRQSPLARRNALSALVVEPEGAAPYSFSFGLAVEDPADGALIPADLEALPRWDGLEESGSVILRDGPSRWGVLYYWLRPRPAFEISTASLGPGIAAGLLGRGLPGGTSVEGLPPGAMYALYSERDGRALLSPWPEAPPLPETLTSQQGRRTAVLTPAGNAWAFSRLGSDGWEVLYLPWLRPVAALERIGNQVVGTGAVLAVIALLFLLLALPRPAFRGLLVRIWRSYARRLLIVFTLVLLVPLPLLNLALITGVKNRLWHQQRVAGEAALVSAQRFLVEYLRDLPTGFGLDTTFEKELRNLAGVVHHDINFYWGSRESRIVSSRRELFAAGLVPKRIPGEVYSRLALGEFNLTSRQRSVAGTRYIEIYAPFRLPGARQTGSFLSIPLLAQQEEIEDELNHLRRQALLLTAALLAVLISISARLTRGFAAPITALVAGTRRIAAGADSLGLATPSDLELAELAEAVDDMAARIARGRRRLMREKQVVDRIVEHITSGVVSLDRERRILMQNQVAEDLIGGVVGESLEELLAGKPRLAPVLEFLEGRGDATAQAAVRLPGDEGEEREWSLVWVPVSGSGEPAALLVVEDATEVLRGQRLAAWAEMARIIAHEIKNPLTPIRLSAEHMREVRSNDPTHFDEVFERCNRNILRQVDELQEIASDFSAYSSILQIDPRPGDLAETLAELVESYQAAPPPGITVTFEADPPTLEARFDARLLSRAVRNLLENAVRANAGSGTVAVTVKRLGDRVRISVADTGPGVAEDHLRRIFDPYFSTHDTGTGLGLPIARRVVEEHGGTIVAHNRPSAGLEVVLEMPC